MPRVGFEPTISPGERPKTYALDRAATGTGTEIHIRMVFVCCFIWTEKLEEHGLKAMKKSALKNVGENECLRELK